MKKNIFEQEVILPDEVENRIDETLSLIRKESEDTLKKNNRKKQYKRKIAAAVAIAVIGVSGISVSAGIYYRWSRSLEKGMQASKQQQEAMEDQGMVSVYTDSQDLSDLAVTQNGVTITPVMAIADEKYGRISFKVSGYEATQGQPDFVEANIEVGEDTSEEYQPNKYMMFYDGCISNDEGAAVYEDGSPLKQDENGDTIYNWEDENGDLEYYVVLSGSGSSKDVLGQKVHVELKNLGHYIDKMGNIDTDVEGTWSFDLTMPGKDAGKVFSVGQEVKCGENVFHLDVIKVSPISTKLSYTISEELAADDSLMIDENYPRFWGYDLKNGERVVCFGGGGSVGREEENRTNFVEHAGHASVVDVSQIEKVVLILPDTGEKVAVDLKK